MDLRESVKRWRELMKECQELEDLEERTPEQQRRLEELASEDSEITALLNEATACGWELDHFVTDSGEPDHDEIIEALIDNYLSDPG